MSWVPRGHALCRPQGAPEGHGACDWPARFDLQGSASGAAQVELRGLIVHDLTAPHLTSGGREGGGAIVTSGDTRLTIANATFIRNSAVRAVPLRRATVPRGRMWRGVHCAGAARREQVSARARACV